MADREVKKILVMTVNAIGEELKTFQKVHQRVTGTRVDPQSRWVEYTRSV